MVKDLEDGKHEQLVGTERGTWIIRAQTAVDRLDRRLTTARAAKDKATAKELDDTLAFLKTGADPAKINPKFTDEGAIRDSFHDQAAADIAVDEVNTAMAANAHIRALATMPIGERPAYLQSLADEIEQGGDADYRKKSAVFQAVFTAADRQTKQLTKDPAGYAIEHDETVTAAYQSMVDKLGEAGPDRTNAIAEYVAAMDTAYDSYGLPNEMRTILPPQLGATIAAQYKDQSRGGENAAGAIAALEETWGDQFPRLFRDLVRGKYLPEGAQVIASMDQPGDSVTRADLAAAQSLDAKEVMPVKADRDEMGEAVRSALEDFNATLTTTAGLRTRPIYEAEITKLATLNVARGNERNRSRARGGGRGSKRAL